MSKVDVFIFSAIVGFGFTAGVQIFITWKIIFNYALSDDFPRGLSEREAMLKLAEWLQRLSIAIEDNWSEP
ncbi:TPA: hypothetical protein MCZ77_005090 [Escherichia coli]|nr:hypothetical protein [Escherichia coli]